jgi:putative aldouronate transport system permease protein
MKETGAVAVRMWRTLRKQGALQIMALFGVTALLVFNIAPLFGLQIAFKDYKFKLGIWGSPWAGLKHFQSIWRDVNIWPILRNTLALSCIKTFLTFPLPIFLAVLLNECRCTWYKRTVQTVSYFPYFISWPIIALLAMNWLSPSSGFINHALVSTGILKEPYFFLGEENAFWWVSLGLEIWKNVGYSSIIFLAAITGVDQEVMEAAVIDGTNRIQRIWYVTIPTILPTVMIMLILSIGSLMGGANFQVSYTLGNTLNYNTSEIIDTYVLKLGMEMNRFSYSTAISLLNSIVSAVLLVSANAMSGRLTGESLF